MPLRVVEPPCVNKTGPRPLRSWPAARRTLLSPAEIRLARTRLAEGESRGDVAESFELSIMGLEVSLGIRTGIYVLIEAEFGVEARRKLRPR